MNYKDLDPKNVVGTPKLVPETQQGTDGECIKDVFKQLFNQAKGMVGEIIDTGKNIISGAINDVKNFVEGVKELVTGVDIEGKIRGLSIKGILDDIKNEVKNGINDAINFGKGILDGAKQARAFLTCEKSKNYRKQSADIDSQLAFAADETAASGEARTRALFSSPTTGTTTRMSPRMRREISNRTPRGSAYINQQTKLAEQQALTGVQQNARNEYNTLAGGNITGIADQVDVSSYG